MSKSSTLRNRHERQQLNLKKERAHARAAWLEGSEAATQTIERALEPEPLNPVVSEAVPSTVVLSNGEMDAVRDALHETVERAKKGELESKQPRFTSTDPQSFFMSVYRWVKEMGLQEPDPHQGPRQYDEWLRTFAVREPYLAGVLNSVIQIDKNRGWSLTGGRNQVARYTQILHAADNEAGWRAYLSWQASSYYTTRLGFVTELGREGQGGPLRALWSVDPARCELTGNVEQPLKYFPRMGGALETQEWTAGDFFRAASMPTTNEGDFGRGYPAVARLLDLAKIMVAVYEHDKEQLGARAPRGLLLLNGIEQKQWETAMEAREEALDENERRYYGGVAVLASSGSNSITATLMALSQLPAGFDIKVFTDMLMYGYALAFGYDAREFWPVSSGSLGTATETDVQHRKATSKGDTDFSLAHQEQLQRQLPSTLQFEYETRDVAGETADVDLALRKAQVIGEMTKWLINNTTSVLTSDQIMQLAAQEGLIPEAWTPVEEDVTVTDTDESNVRERVLDDPHVRRAIELFPDEPLVRYEFPSRRTRILARRGADLLKRRSFTVSKVKDEFYRALEEFKHIKSSSTQPDLLQTLTALLVQNASRPQAASVVLQADTVKFPVQVDAKVDTAPIARAIAALKQEPQKVDVKVDTTPIARAIAALKQREASPEIISLLDKLIRVISEKDMAPQVSFPKQETQKVDVKVDTAPIARAIAALKQRETSPEIISLLDKLIRTISEKDMAPQVTLPAPIINNEISVPEERKKKVDVVWNSDGRISGLVEE